MLVLVFDKCRDKNRFRTIVISNNSFRTTVFEQLSGYEKQYTIRKTMHNKHMLLQKHGFLSYYAETLATTTALQ